VLEGLVDELALSGQALPSKFAASQFGPLVSVSVLLSLFVLDSSHRGLETSKTAQLVFTW